MMFRQATVLLFICSVLSAVEYVYSDCGTTIGSHKCFPVPVQNTNICVSNALHNTANLTWFDSHNACEKVGGRLVQLHENIDPIGLRRYLHIKGQHLHFNSTTYILRTGLLLSINGDNKTFWRNTENDSSVSCNISGKICSNVVSAKDCSTLGCCMEGNRCLYPVNQTSIPTYTTDTGVEISPGIDTRQCVGFIRYANTSIWKWKAFNCSKTGFDENAEIISACEYKCGDTWPTSYANTATSPLSTTRTGTPTTSTPTKVSLSSSTSTTTNDMPNAKKSSGTSYQSLSVFTITSISVVTATELTFLRN